MINNAEEERTEKKEEKYSHNTLLVQQKVNQSILLRPNHILTNLNHFF